MADKRSKGTIRINESTYEKVADAAGKIGYSVSQFADSALLDAVSSIEAKEPEFPRVAKMIKALAPPKPAKKP